MKKPTFFTVGPAQLYPTTPQHIRHALAENIASISHRSQQFKDIYAHTVLQLRSLLSIPETHQVFFLSSANEIWERILQNTVRDSSFHLVNGAFSQKFYEFALALGKKPLKFTVPEGQGFILSEIAVPEKNELICVTHNETSTGVMTPMVDVVELKRQNPNALLALDIVSSVPYVTVDFSVVDMAFFSVQKGFGLPAGLGVLIVNQAAMKKALSLAQAGVVVGTYHSFLSLEKYGQKLQTCETPNVLAIYLLGQVCQDMIKIGKEKIVMETEKKAALLYNAFDRHARLKPAVEKPEWRSQTTIAVKTPEGSEMVIKRLKQAGCLIGAGYGHLKPAQIRIANFPTHTQAQIKRLIALIAE